MICFALSVLLDLSDYLVLLRNILTDSVHQHPRETANTNLVG